MQKNQEIEIDIIDITAEGNGVGRYEGMTVFVPLTAIGDRVRVKILKVKKTLSYGKVIDIIIPSPYRIESDCLVFHKCGGCVFRHITYENELNIKSNRVYEAIKRIGGVDLKPQPIISDNNINGYRNKAQYPVDLQGQVGFYAFHSHRIIPQKSCLLQPKIFSDIVGIFESWVKKNHISIYNESEHKGLLRHLYIRYAHSTNQIMVVLVINGDSIPFSEELITCLKESLGNTLKSVQLNINKKNTNVILGEKCVNLYGYNHITDILCGISVRISPLSFYQVNRNMTELLYRKAIEYTSPKNQNILDLYCGAGTIGLSMAKSAKSIIGVEIVKEAVDDAIFNAKTNNITNARFICADASSAAKKLIDEKIHIDTVIVDPPRKGCSEELIKTISLQYKPEKIVYVSCDPATLARDIKTFIQLGYNLLEYTPVDLFPRTSHVETVALLSRQKPKNK